MPDEAQQQSEQKPKKERAPWYKPEYLAKLAQYTEDQMREYYAKQGIILDHPIFTFKDTLHTGEQLARHLGNGNWQVIKDHLLNRNQWIKNMQADPLNYGFESTSKWHIPPRIKPWMMDYRPYWEDADKLLAEKREVLVLGGNRSGKSEWAAKRIVQALCSYNIGDSRKPPIIWSFSTTEETSKRDIQPLIYKYLPLEWKSKRVKSIVYNSRTRFADNYFVCPNGAEWWGKNYRQDPMTIEGGQVDIAWCDEDVPVEWLVTLRSRLIDRAGKMIITFTPINGWNATVAEYLVGCKVTDWCECDMYPNDRNWPGGPVGKVPYIGQPVNRDHGIIWFQPRWNPYIDYRDLKSAWQTKDRGQVLIRLYGAVQKAGGTKFPKFGAHNIVKRSQIPEKGTDYHLTDFAWARPWAMIWVRVVRIKDRRWIYVVKDWPNVSTYGEWVVPSGKKKDGERGPAQNPIGYGIESYAGLIREVEKEHKLNVSVRLGDPRSGKAPAVTEEDGGTDLISLMAAQDIFIQPAKGVAENEGINIINDWLDYDESKPVDSTNQPMLYVSEECQQVIDCLKTWTGGDGLKGASKDFIDLLRYAAVEDVDELTPSMFQTYGGFSY